MIRKLCFRLLCISVILANSAYAAKGPKQIGQYSGFEGNEEVLGVEILISDWQDDGMVTLTVPEVAEAWLEAD